MWTPLSLRSPPGAPGNQPGQQALPQAELGWLWQVRCGHGGKLGQVLGDGLHDFCGEHTRRQARYLLLWSALSHQPVLVLEPGNGLKVLIRRQQGQIVAQGHRRNQGIHGRQPPATTA